MTFNLPERMAFENITAEVEDVVRESGVQEGLALVNAMHITASVFINDDEPGLHEDYRRWLEKLAPFDPSPEAYQHNRTGEDNGDAHHKRTLEPRDDVRNDQGLPVHRVPQKPGARPGEIRRTWRRA